MYPELLWAYPFTRMEINLSWYHHKFRRAQVNQD